MSSEAMQARWTGMNKKAVGRGIALVPERIERAILLLRGHKVILDADLAGLYDVETKALKRAVKRNLGALPRRFHVRA